LQHFPEAQEQHDGKNTIIVFIEGIGKYVKGSPLEMGILRRCYDTC